VRRSAGEPARRSAPAATKRPTARKRARR
jgi:hypothetical protein